MGNPEPGSPEKLIEDHYLNEFEKIVESMMKSQMLSGEDFFRIMVKLDFRIAHWLHGILKDEFLKEYLKCIADHFENHKCEED